MANIESFLTIARGISGTVIVTFVGAALGILLQVAFARILGVNQYGLYAYLIAWAMVLALFSRLGLETSLMRLVPTYMVGQEYGALRGLILTSKLAALIAGIVLAGATIYLLKILDESIASESVHLLLSFWVLVPLLALIGIIAAILRGLHHPVLANGLDGIVVKIILGAGIGIVVLLGYSTTATVAITIHAAALLGAIGLGHWLISAVDAGDNLAGTREYRVRTWARISLPLLLIAGAQRLLKYSDILLVGLLLTARAAGIYAVTSRITAILTLGIGAANSVLAPKIAEHYAAGSLKDLQGLLQRLAMALTGITILIAGALVAFGNEVLSIFGEEFREGYLCLTILLLGQIMNTAAGSVGFVMTMTDHQREAARIMAVTLFANLILNALLIPRFGIEGAAVATAASMCVWNLWMLIYARTVVRIDPSIFAVFGREKA